MPTRTDVRFLDRTTPPHIVTLVLMSGLGAMNLSVFLPSLPSMTAHFQTDYATMQLAVSLYLAATAVLQLFIGPLSDRFGRRTVFLGCLAVFLIATIGCAVAPTIEVFLIFRMLQATVAAGFTLSRAVVRDMVPQNEAAAMIGYVTMGMALVPMFAPMIGGVLDQAFGWQSTFVFLGLFGLGVFTLSFFDQGETATGRAASFREQMAQTPELFASPRFWGYVFCAAFASGCFFAFLGGAPYVASEIYGLSAFWAGVGFGAPAIGYATGNFISGRYSVRYGINRMIFAGAAFTAVGMGICAALSAMGFGSAVLFFASCTTVGVGNGLVMPNSTAGMLSVRPHLAGTAAGIGTSIMIGGGAALSVLAGILLEGRGTDVPLLVMMFISALLGLIAIQLVVLRERRLARG
ncbi:MAG: multidrug effflux MFS transporter [Rhodobacteraceae bacterium]|nr:multidrug effflux MFS transporter [Paracoccaceae bacterium]